ncbi:hypothetical protein RFI_12234 [Reticulomyxa filosa]|uniref:Transmembrane protein n=1 Tax=Reticulomyxa filosa TaxID=46433 RepID=X6NGU5_RETFI|nr:hypothetical protein RFI_12234 [Reticulomyxa filosa]|eukprot:ETO24924.1 hypothetical protein RFI_12234 [Reticulomyxa filosa]
MKLLNLQIKKNVSRYTSFCFPVLPSLLLYIFLIFNILHNNYFSQFYLFTRENPNFLNVCVKFKKKKLNWMCVCTTIVDKKKKSLVQKKILSNNNKTTMIRFEKKVQLLDNQSRLFITLILVIQKKEKQKQTDEFHIWKLFLPSKENIVLLFFLPVTTK